jgi:hypothetical protein
MVRRMSAAACAAALVGMLATPVESSARGGGFATGHVRGFHPVVRPIHRVHPFVHAHRPPLPHRPLVRHPLVRDAFHAAARRHHRAVFGVFGFYGFGLPVTYGDDGAFIGSYYDPSDVTGALDPPAPALPPASLPLSVRAEAIVDRGGCRSEIVPVPSPGGAERSVTITRC